MRGTPACSYKIKIDTEGISVVKVILPSQLYMEKKYNAKHDDSRHEEKLWRSNQLLALLPTTQRLIVFWGNNRCCLGVKQLMCN